MDRYDIEFPNRATPDEEGEEDRLVQQKGREHEEEFLQALRGSSREVLDLSAVEGRYQSTLNAMRSGRDVIYQGELRSSPFAGFPDFLVKVDGDSGLGSWHYEVWDTKLARHPKPYFLIQLCCYADMLEAAQERRPREVQVVLGTKEARRFRTDDFFYFYRSLRSAFLDLQRTFDPDQPPDIPGLRDLGRWSSHAARVLEERDDLSLVANIRGSQIRRLKKAGISTATQLAASAGVRVPRVDSTTLDRLRRQARLQMAARGAERPPYELFRMHQGRTWVLRSFRRPRPTTSSSTWRDSRWSTTASSTSSAWFHWTEPARIPRLVGPSPHGRKAGLRGLRRLGLRAAADGSDLHIYHYAAYERTALRRLMGRYGSREEEVDDFLRGHGCSWTSSRSCASSDRRAGYSLKDIE